LLERHRSASSAEWIILTGYGTVPDSVRALRLGGRGKKRRVPRSERRRLG